MRLKPSVVVFVLALAPISVTALGAEDNPLVHEGVVAAPLDDVWTAFTTKEGQESWMVAHSEIDLKIGGRMRTHYDRKGTIGDAKTVENTIICYDPKRMLSIKVTMSPEGFPFPNAVKNMWTVIYFQADSPKTTRVRIVGLGFGDDEESKKMRAFFDRGNAFTLKKLQERFASKNSGSRRPAEPPAEADRGRHPGFPRFNVIAGGPGSLALSFGGGGRLVLPRFEDLNDAEREWLTSCIAYAGQLVAAYTLNLVHQPWGSPHRVRPRTGPQNFGC